MPDTFPSITELLGDMINLESHTDAGQHAMAKWIYEFAKRWDLGDAKLVSYPKDVPYGGAEPEPYNVVIEAGEGTEELVIWHGHFDTVPPDDYDPDHNPLEFRHVTNDIYTGLGSYDMLGGIAAYLYALKDLKIAKHRRIRLVLVGKEEDQSQGTYAACDSGNNLFAGATCAISTELLVGGALTDPPMVVIGRPGRVAFDVHIKKPKWHVGAVKRSFYHQLAALCDARAKLAVMNIQLTGHHHDTLGLLNEPLCVVSGWGAKQPSSLSVSDEAWFKVQVHYTDPSMTPADIQERIQKELEPIAGNDLSVTIESGRVTPLCKPWLERHDDPFVKNIFRIASEVTKNNDLIDPILKGGGGVADETVISHEERIPVVCLPSTGEGEHTHRECVDMRSITDYQIPMLREIAAFPGSIIH